MNQLRRICRKCHKPSRRDVCETCRRVTKVFVDRERFGFRYDDVRPHWLAVVEKRLFKS